MNVKIYHDTTLKKCRKKTSLTFKSFPWVNDSIVVSVKELNVLSQNILIVWYWFLINCTLNS